MITFIFYLQVARMRMPWGVTTYRLNNIKFKMLVIFTPVNTKVVKFHQDRTCQNIHHQLELESFRYEEIFKPNKFNIELIK